MMEKKVYEEPIAEVVSFDGEDVITTSGPNPAGDNDVSASGLWG